VWRSCTSLKFTSRGVRSACFRRCMAGSSSSIGVQAIKIGPANGVTRWSHPHSLGPVYLDVKRPVATESPFLHLTLEHRLPQVQRWRRA
jgi:hypothetical protein